MHNQGSVSRQAPPPEALYPFPVEGRRRGEAAPLYRIEYDPRDKLILFTVQGFWDAGETSAYLEKGQAFVSECRRRHGRVRVLSDRRNAVVQPAQVAELLKSGTSAVHPEDRVAIVVSSSLVKLQLHRAIAHPLTQSFLSIDAARTWLTAYP